MELRLSINQSRGVLSVVVRIYWESEMYGVAAN
jgi:hypothetical protein